MPTTRTEKYHQAAITYFIYGLLYLAGAVYLARMDVVDRSGWAWFLVGSIFVLGLPPLIWYGFKWVTRILALLVFVRVAGLIRTIITDDGTTIALPWSGTLPIRIGAFAFLIIAAVTGAMLARAGWEWESTTDPHSPD